MMGVNPDRVNPRIPHRGKSPTGVPGGQHQAPRTTDPQGLAELRALAVGPWTLQVRSPGYTASRQVVTIGTTRVLSEARIELARSATVGGVVRDLH
jgi:hypothetical protein